jgi:integrase
MKRYRLTYRGIRDAYYSFDTHTKKRQSLGTNNPDDAQRLIDAKNEAVRHPEMNLQIAQIYLQHGSPELKGRTWQHVMENIISTKAGTTRERWQYAIQDKAFDLIRNRKLLETTAEHFLQVLKSGTVATNVFLRRAHNFAVGMHWLPWPVLPKLHWPTVNYKEKRAITAEEHRTIIQRERNPELRNFYELLWHLGASQTDLATLQAEDVDWEERTISFQRCKTKVPVVISFGAEAGNILAAMPRLGPLFPWLSRLHERHRAKHFIKRLGTVGITGVSLHSYRYAWAERAKTAGMPERFAQQALGHSSKAFARAYSKKAKVTVPSLEEYEGKIVLLRKCETLAAALPTSVNGAA